jgi:hypothetical protein
MLETEWLYNDNINKLLEWAKLHIVQGEPYAWIEKWDARYYFHNSTKNPVEEVKYETMTGEKKKYIVWYDGMEIW